MNKILKLLNDDRIQTDFKTLSDSYLNNQSDRDFLLLKLAEECSELSAELVQKVLHPTHTDNTAIEQELGDVLNRLILILPLINSDEVAKRIQFKLSKSYDERFKK